MLRASRVPTLLIVVVLLAVACSSGGGSTGELGGGVNVPDAVKNLPRTWSKAAVARIRDLAKGLQAIDPEACSDFTVMPVPDYGGVLLSLQTATVIPETIGACSVGAEDESVEIVVFAKRADRDRFIEERRERLCTVAKRQGIRFPGLRFVSGKDWSVQTDSQTVALDVADALGGKYRLAACGDPKGLDWDPASVKRLRALADRMNTAGYACAFAFDDKDLTKATPHYQQVGLPGALGSCEADFGPDRAPTFGLVGFSPDTTPAEKFLPAELAELCSGGADVRIVRGDGWAAFVVTESTAQLVATALGGSVDPMTCPPRPAAATPGSPAP